MQKSLKFTVSFTILLILVLNFESSKTLNLKSTINISEKNKKLKTRNLETTCEKGYYPHGTDCYQCYQNCISCTGTICTECNLGYYANGMSCYQCYPNCINCNGANCLECIKGYYPNGMDCYNCYENCLSCDGNKCTECIKGYYPNGMDCYHCYDKCTECTETKCLSCEEGYKIFGMGCYKEETEITICDNENGYYILKSDYLLNKENPEYPIICLDKKIVGSHYFINSIIDNGQNIKYWDTCAENCLECDGENENQCIECDSINYYKLYEDKEKNNNFTCYKVEEKTNYYFYTENSIQYLRKCSDNCATCENYMNDKCTSCNKINYFIKYEDLQNSIFRCYSAKELPNYYLYKQQYFKECIGGKCVSDECDISCANCLLDDETECISCNIYDNYYPLTNTINDDSFKCYSLKNYTHFYLDEKTNSLSECSKNCATCIKNPDYCLTCSEGAYYIEGESTFECYSEPPYTNYVLNKNLKIWQKCFYKCNTCFISTNSVNDQQCNSCNVTNGFYPYKLDFDTWNNGDNIYDITGFNCYSKDQVKSNYFLNDEKWTKCSKSCSKCDYKEDNCLECNYESEYYNIKYQKNGTCFKNPLAGYILDSDKEFNNCFRTCKYCQTTSNSFLYMQCKECDNINYVLANDSYDKSYCIPKDNSDSYFIKKQLKWHIENYDVTEMNKMYDIEKLNDIKYENLTYTLTYECPLDKPYIIYSIRQCVKKCSNLNDIVEYGLFINKLLYFYNNICYDECPYGSKPNNETMTCIEINIYNMEELNIVKKYDEYFQEVVNIYLARSANNTIFEIQSESFTNFLYNSSTNDSLKYKQKMPIFDFTECENLLRKKYNLPNNEDIHIGIYQQNDLDTKKNNILLLSAINTTTYQFFTSNGTLLDFSVCNKITISAKYPIDTTKSLFDYSLAKTLYDNFNVSIFDSSNNFFTDMCIPVEINGKDTNAEIRSSKISSKLKLCDDGCDFKGIDFEKNYSLCECEINYNPDNKNKNFGEFLKENDENINLISELIENGDLLIIKCLFKTEFNKKNGIFIVSLIIFVSQIILCLLFFLYEYG